MSTPWPARVQLRSLQNLLRQSQSLRRQHTSIARHQHRSLSQGFFSQGLSPYKRRPTVENGFIRRTFATSQADPYASYNSARRVIWLIIGLNTGVFAAWQYATYNRDGKLTQFLRENATISLHNVKEGRWWTTVTSAFSHKSISHFAFNMFTFWTFGTLLSWIPGVGGLHILVCSIGSAVSGSLTFLYHQQYDAPSASDRLGTSVARLNDFNSALGASGMVMGAGAVATCLMPFVPMNIMFIPISIPLWLVTVLFVGLDTYYLGANDGVGHSAHLGGSIYGVLYYLAYLRRYGGVWSMIRGGLRR